MYSWPGSSEEAVFFNHLIFFRQFFFRNMPKPKELTASSVIRCRTGVTEPPIKIRTYDHNKKVSELAKSFEYIQGFTQVVDSGDFFWKFRGVINKQGFSSFFLKFLLYFLLNFQNYSHWPFGMFTAAFTSINLINTKNWFNFFVTT